MFRFFDSHCHVSFEAYKEDVDAVMARARVAGVGMLTVGTTAYTNEAAVRFANVHPDVWAAVGIHPCHVHAPDYHDDNELPEGMTHQGVIDEEGRVNLDELRVLAQNPKVVAIGEFGLDYYRLKTDDDGSQRIMTDQQAVARAQLQLATELQKPVVIHCRDAHVDMTDLIKEEIAHGGLLRRGVIHCFTGTIDEAMKYVELGFMISFSGIITFGKNVAEVVPHVPLESILIETDAPYLAPTPYRGKRNEPAYVVETAQKIADMFNLPLEKVAEQTVKNAERMFQITP